MLYFVYELVDPRTDVAAYVGITNNPNQRLFEHLEMRAGNAKKNAWILQLLTEQVKPKIRILEIVDDLGQARRQERHWIQHYVSQGVQLTNSHLVKALKSEETSKEFDKKMTRIARARYCDSGDTITEKLRQQILQGDFGTQGRLPSISMLCRQYNTKREMINYAFQQLEAEGLLTSRGTARGFVSLRNEIGGACL